MEAGASTGPAVPGRRSAGIWLESSDSRPRRSLGIKKGTPFVYRG